MSRTKSIPSGLDLALADEILSRTAILRMSLAELQRRTRLSRTVTETAFSGDRVLDSMQQQRIAAALEVPVSALWRAAEDRYAANPGEYDARAAGTAGRD